MITKTTEDPHMKNRSMQPEELPSMLTVKETALFTRLGLNTVYNLVNTGTLPSVRVGRQIRINRRALFEYLGI